MDFSLTEEQIMIRDAARDFAQTELLPGVIDRDENQRWAVVNYIRTLQKK